MGEEKGQRAQRTAPETGRPQIHIRPEVLAFWVRSFSPSPSPDTQHFGGFENPRIVGVGTHALWGAEYGEIGTSGRNGERPAEDFGLEFPTPEVSPHFAFRMGPSILSPVDSEIFDGFGTRYWLGGKRRG